VKAGDDKQMKKDILKGSDSIKDNMYKLSNTRMRQESSEVVSSRNHINIHDIPIAQGQHRRISTFIEQKPPENI
jgi:hypothetical protein